MEQRIVVGVDGSPGSTRALEWALALAQDTGADVEAVHAWHWDLPGLDVVSPETPVLLAEAARRTVDAQVHKAAANSPAGVGATQVRQRTVEGDAATALVAAAGDSALLVLGRHGQSTVSRRLIGSVLGHVAAHCLHRSASPVALVPAEAPAHRPDRIVVGVDGSAASERALRWAVEHGRRVGAPVVAVLAWQLTTLPAPSSAAAGWAVPPLPEWEASAERLLDETVRRSLPAEQAAEVSTQVLHAPAVAGLLGAVTPQDLLVLADRGRGGFDRLLLGSVSRQCAEHAVCPVVVVPPRERGHHEQVAAHQTAT